MAPRRGLGRRLPDSFYDWDDGIYVISKKATLAGPFESLATAIRSSRDFDALVWLDGAVVLRHVEEAGYGASERIVKAFRGTFTVIDTIDGSTEGRFRSLEKAIAQSKLFEVGPTTTEIWCTSLPTEQIVSSLTLFDHPPSLDGFVAVNGQLVTHSQIHSQRHVDDPDQIVSRLKRALRRAARGEARQSSAAASSPPAQSASFVEKFYRGLGGRAGEARELRRVIRAIEVAPPAAALLVLEQSPSTRDWSDVEDLREAIRRASLSEARTQ